MLDVSLYSTVYNVYTYRIVHTRFRFRLNIKPSQNNKRILLLYFNCMRFVFLCYCCRRCLCVQRKYLCWMSLFSVFWCLYVCFALHSSICIIFTFFRCVDDFKGHLWWSRQKTAQLTAFGWFSWLFYTKRREKKIHSSSNKFYFHFICDGGRFSLSHSLCLHCISPLFVRWAGAILVKWGPLYSTLCKLMLIFNRKKLRFFNDSIDDKATTQQKKKRVLNYIITNGRKTKNKWASEQAMIQVYTYAFNSSIADFHSYSGTKSYKIFTIVMTVTLAVHVHKRHFQGRFGRVWRREAERDKETKTYKWTLNICILLKRFDYCH